MTLKVVVRRLEDWRRVKRRKERVGEKGGNKDGKGGRSRVDYFSRGFSRPHAEHIGLGSPWSDARFENKEQAGFKPCCGKEDGRTFVVVVF